MNFGSRRLATSIKLLGKLLGLISGLGTSFLYACNDDETGAPNAADAGPDTTIETDGGTDCPPRTVPSCTATKCTAEAGEPAVCVRGACVKLKSPDCTRVGGDLSGGNVVLLGALLAQNGANAGSGTTRINSLELAIKEVNAAGGIGDPDKCKPARTLAFLACDDANLAVDGGADAGLAIDRLRAARHLIDDLDVPVIVGGSTSGNTLDIAKNATMPSKVMQFAPSSTAIAITAPTDFNASPDGVRLLWRAAPSDIAQSAALQKIYLLLEQEVKQGGTTAPRLALVTKNDAYGKGIEAAFKAGLLVDGAAIPNASFRGIMYKNSDADPEGTTQAQTVIELADFKPDIVVMAGTSEATTGILEDYEATSPAKKPLYLLADGQKKPELIALVESAPSETTREDLRKRIRGTQPGVLTPLTQTFFNFSYKTAYGADSVLSYGMAGTYDIGYLLTYAIAATKGGPINGPALATNMALLTGGTQLIDVGPSALPRGLEAMRKGEKVDFNGASGPLDFDPATGEAPSDYSVWCVRIDPNTKKPIYEEATGLSYSAKEQKVLGTYACP